MTISIPSKHRKTLDDFVASMRLSGYVLRDWHESYMTTRMTFTRKGVRHA